MINIQKNIHVSGLRLLRRRSHQLSQDHGKNCVSPISMAEPDILLEEPPRIVKQLDTSHTSSPTLSDISSLSSYSFSSSSGSSSSCSCSDSDSDSDNDIDLSKKDRECSRGQKTQENRDESK